MIQKLRPLFIKLLGQFSLSITCSSWVKIDFYCLSRSFFCLVKYSESTLRYCNFRALACIEVKTSNAAVITKGNYQSLADLRTKKNFVVIPDRIYKNQRRNNYLQYKYVSLCSFTWSMILKIANDLFKQSF